MADCNQVSRQYFRNDLLCRWLETQQKIAPSAMDQQREYTDLTDPQNPIKIELPPDGVVQPDELAQQALTLLEEEWRSEMPDQPIAEGLFEFGFLPPWLPPPFSQMNQEDKEKVKKFIAVAKQSTPLTLFKESEIRYDMEGAVYEDSLLAAISAGSVLGCVGLLNPFLFAREIVLKRDVQAAHLYMDRLVFLQHPHLAAFENGILYDYSNAARANPAAYFWYPLSKLDHWAVSLMNTGLNLRERKIITEKVYIDKYLRRAFELAPHHFLVCFNLGVALIRNGRISEGKELLKKAQKIYPQYERLKGWEERLR